MTLNVQLLLAYVNTSRYEGPEIDGTMVEGDALSLYNAGEKKLGTDEKTFIAIFSDRSKAHLTAVCSAYHRFGRSLEKVHVSCMYALHLYHPEIKWCT